MEAQTTTTVRHNLKRASPGVISHGWAMLTYDGKPICLLGSGDQIPACAFQEPMTISPVGQLVVDNEAIPDGDPSARFLRGLSRHTARLSASALEATADFLLELADKIDPARHEHLTVGLPLTQGQLAELLGMSPVHINRTLKQLAKMDLVHHAKGLFTITSRRRLVEVANVAE